MFAGEKSERIFSRTVWLKAWFCSADGKSVGKKPRVFSQKSFSGFGARIACVFRTYVGATLFEGAG